MSSIVQHTYPRVVWRDDEKKLWNPIHKKALKNLPEERVRLRVIEALMQSGWSKHRISTEEGIGQIGDTAMRTDIIFYDQQFKPKILVECKAEYIPISDQTAEQVARYNHKVKAPYLLLTNGVTDYWYRVDGNVKKVEKQDRAPEVLSDKELPEDINFEYWKNRGFIGNKAAPQLRKWLRKTLPNIWLSEGRQVQYLSLGSGPSDVEWSHYYCIIPVNEQDRLAITSLNTAYGGNRMVVILNTRNENKAVLEINLDLLADEKKGNCTLFSEENMKVLNLGNHCDLFEHQSADKIAEQLHPLLKNYSG